MHIVTLTLMFLACLTCGRRLRSVSEQRPSSYSLVQRQELQSNGSADAWSPLRPLAAFLLSHSNPSSGWAVSGQGHDLAKSNLRRRCVELRMAEYLDTQEPGAQQRWDRFLESVAAGKQFEDSPSVDSALSLCQAAALSRDCDPATVCEALATLEKGMRATAKSDDGELSRSTLASLDGAWRLVFTTGTAETQSKLGRKINYFPLRATQTFNTSDMSITNAIYLSKFPLLKFFGSFDWIEDRRRLEFDFDSIAVGGVKFDLPKGGAEELGAATGLGASNNVERAKQGKKAFFNWISADDHIATARGGGGGLALWRRDTEMEGLKTHPPTFMTPTVFTADSLGFTFVPEGEAPPVRPVSNREAEWNPTQVKIPGCVDCVKAPLYLDGSLVGDVGFDPLCLLAYANEGMNIASVSQTAAGRKSQMLSLSPEEQQRKVAWMREAELKHGRLAMLAAAGWPLAELWNAGGGSLYSINGRAPSLFNGNLSDYGFFLFLVSIVLHAIEINSFDNMQKPGDLGFDPLDYYRQEGPTKQKELQLAELKNGRLAMLAITGFAVQEFIYGNPVIKQTPFFFR